MDDTCWCVWLDLGSYRTRPYNTYRRISHWGAGVSGDPRGRVGCSCGDHTERMYTLPVDHQLISVPCAWVSGVRDCCGTEGHVWYAPILPWTAYCRQDTLMMAHRRHAKRCVSLNKLADETSSRIGRTQTIPHCQWVGPLGWRSSCVHCVTCSLRLVPTSFCSYYLQTWPGVSVH